MKTRRFGIAVAIFLLGFSAFIQVMPSPQSQASPAVTVTKGVNYDLVDYGNRTYRWVSTSQRLWDNLSRAWVDWTVEDLRSTLGFIQVRNGRIGVRVYPYYVEYWNPNMTEIRVYMEQWQVEALNPTNQKWASVAMPSPSFQPEVTSIIQNTTGVYVYQIYPQNYAGRLTVVYIVKAGEALKHEINYISLLSTREHKVHQIWSGIISEKVRHGSTLSNVTGLTVFSDYIYEWMKADGRLVVRENQRSAKGYFKEASIDVDAKGSKATFTFQNASLLTISNGNGFIIDPTTDTFTASPWSAVRNGGTNYATVQAATTGDDVHVSNPHVGQGLVAGSYTVYRSPLSFDTSGLSDVAIISAVKLSVWGYFYTPTVNFVIRVQKWTEGQAVTTADYDGFDGVNYDDGNFNTVNWVNGAWNNITISTTSVVSVTSFTDLMLRSAKDISQTAPTDAIEYVSSYTNAPILTVTYTLPNNAPTNGAVSITMDDTNNIYAQKQDYTLTITVTDLDGYEDIATVDISFQQGVTVRETFRYNEDTNAFSVTTSNNQYELGTGSSATRSGNTIDVSLKFRLRWGGTEEASVDIKVVSTDDEPASDTDTTSDYFDAVKTLTVSSFASNPVTYVNPSASLTMSGTVYYVNNPASSTASTSYPPDAEFTSVIVHDSAHATKGTDSTIVNGAFSLTITAEATAGARTVHPYINMADADYTDADASGITDSYTVYATLTISTIYQFDQSTSLTAGLYLSYQDTTNGTGPTKYAYTASKTFYSIVPNDVIRLKAQWTNTSSTDGGVQVNGSASVDITMDAVYTRTLYLSVFKSTVLAFQYSDASTSFPTAKVTSVVVTNTGNTTTLTLTTLPSIGLVRNGTYTISSTNIFWVDVKDTASFTVTADSSTKTLVAKVHKPSLNTRRNDGTAITPTSIVLVAPGNLTSLTISSSYATLVMVEGAYTPSSINFYGSDVKLNATTFTPTSMSGQFTFNTIIYTRTPTFKNSAGAALYTQSTSYKVTSVNTTLSSSLTPGSSAIIVGGTSTVSAITWQGTDVTPSSATFDSASGNPDFSLKVYALNVQNTRYPSTTLSTAHSITFPNSTAIEKTPSSGWINMTQVQGGSITLSSTITVSSTERYRSYNTSAFTLSANTNRVHHWLHEYSASLTPKGVGGFTPNTAPTTLSFTLLNGTSKSLSPGSATWLLAGAGSVSSVTWQSIEVVASSTSVTIASGTDYTFNTLITKDTDGNFNFAIGGATAISFSSLASNKLSFTATASTGSHTLKLEIISPSYQVQPSKVSVDTTDYLSSTVGWVFSTTLFTVPLSFASSPTIIVDFTQTSPGANPPSVTTTTTPPSSRGTSDTTAVTFGEPTVWKEFTQETAVTTTATTTAVGIGNVSLPVVQDNPIASLIPEPYATGLLVGLVSSAGVLIILAVKAQQYNKQFSVRMQTRERYLNRTTKPRVPQRAPFLMFFGSVFGILGTLLIVGEPKFQSLFAGLFLPPQSVFSVANGLTSEAYAVALIFGGIIAVFGVALFSTGLGFYRDLHKLGVVGR